METLIDREQERKANKSRLFRDGWYRQQTQWQLEGFHEHSVKSPLAWFRVQQSFISLEQVNAKLEESMKSRLNR